MRTRGAGGRGSKIPKILRKVIYGRPLTSCSRGLCIESIGSARNETKPYMYLN